MKNGTAYDYASGGHINATLWEGTAGSTNLTYWVEIGYTKGWQGSNALTWYRADNRPNGLGYFQHKINTPGITAGTWHTLQIEFVGSNKWQVTIDGTKPNNGGGAWTSNPSPGKSMQAGLESTSECSNMGSQSSPRISDNLTYLIPGCCWQVGWPSGTGFYSPGPANVEWVGGCCEDLHYWL